jgi:hypothetical protein
MPNHSSKKKKGPQSNITIDEKHTQMLNEFHAVESDTIPELEQTLIVLKNQFSTDFIVSLFQSVF